MSEAPPESTEKPSVSALRCWLGAIVAGLLTIPLYRLTQAISDSFAAHPLTAANQTAISLSIAVRTLVVGLSTLATAIFAIAALGLLGLGIQLTWQQFFIKPSR